MPVTDDEIIRRRLLIDGDGGMDDKRINNLIRMFIKWSQSKDNDEGDVVYTKLSSTLALCEHTMQKSVLVYEMNFAQQSHYFELINEIEKKLKEASANIVTAKSELLKAKQIRKNRQEYDSLAKIIQQQPDRKESNKKLSELESELAQQKDTKDALDQKLELRKKQFHVLISAIHNLMDTIKDDESSFDTVDMDVEAS